ncbi:glycosyltransferase family 4 protein [Shewanella baltica]|uniref:glycosyltransferase family 4 protein n=1 Tax=Shewanella baltica TaxID=62322 RepID=UPI00217D49D6|nr:glycosyltransferase family 4 protein [Shewanella baltica]MCS6095024.1 glycosyltransferase family 4 protein [Shewanella baltica]MCS6226132.1 glycosyltransferase family 4 protein [Shewanella baltica]
MKRKIPILLMIDHFGSGGAQRQIVNIANGLVDNGEDVHIFIYYPQYTHHKVSLDKRVVIHEAVKSDKLGLSVVVKLITVLYRFKYKSALVFLNTPAFYLELASFFYFKRLAITYSERTSLELLPTNFLSNLRYEFHGVCKNITSNSIVQSEKLKRKYANKNVFYIPNVMPDSFFDIDINPEALINKVFVVIAHTTPFKNFSYVAESLVLYKKNFSTSLPVIHWYGRIIESDELIRIKSMLVDNDLTDNLVFCGPSNDIPKILEKSFMLIHPSKYESSSNSVAEAFATGTPVILGDIADHKIILEESFAGYLVDIEKPLDLALCLRHSMDINVTQYNILCDNAKNYALKNFKADPVIEKYLGILS